MTWVIDNSKHTGLSFVTLLMIANHANAEGQNSFPSMKTLARECRSSVRSIQRTILKLEASGELGVTRSGGRVAHIYNLPLMPNVDTEATLSRRQRGQDGYVKRAERGRQMTALQRGQSDHVESQRGQITHPNVDIGDANVDIAVSTEPIEPLDNKNRAHARLMAYHAGHIEGDIPNPAAQGNAVKWLLERYSPEQCESVYAEIRAEDWRTTPVTWLTVRKEIGDRLRRASSARPTVTDRAAREAELKRKMGWDKLERTA